MCLQRTDLTLWGVAFVLMDGGFKRRRDEKEGWMLEGCCVCGHDGIFAGREKLGISNDGIHVNPDPSERLPPRINSRICASQLPEVGSHRISGQILSEKMN